MCAASAGRRPTTRSTAPSSRSSRRASEDRNSGPRCARRSADARGALRCSACSLTASSSAVPRARSALDLAAVKEAIRRDTGYDMDVVDAEAALLRCLADADAPARQRRRRQARPPCAGARASSRRRRGHPPLLERRPRRCWRRAPRRARCSPTPPPTRRRGTTPSSPRSTRSVEAAGIAPRRRRATSGLSLRRRCRAADVECSRSGAVSVTRATRVRPLATRRASGARGDRARRLRGASTRARRDRSSTGDQAAPASTRRWSSRRSLCRLITSDHRAATRRIVEHRLCREDGHGASATRSTRRACASPPAMRVRRARRARRPAAPPPPPPRAAAAVCVDQVVVRRHVVVRAHAIPSSGRVLQAIVSHAVGDGVGETATGKVNVGGSANSCARRDGDVPLTSDALNAARRLRLCVHAGSGQLAPRSRIVPCRAIFGHAFDVRGRGCRRFEPGCCVLMAAKTRRAALGGDERRRAPARYPGPARRRNSGGDGCVSRCHPR